MRELRKLEVQLCLVFASLSVPFNLCCKRQPFNQQKKRAWNHTWSPCVSLEWIIWLGSWRVLFLPSTLAFLNVKIKCKVSLNPQNLSCSLIECINIDAWGLSGRCLRYLRPAEMSQDTYSRPYSDTVQSTSSFDIPFVFVLFCFVLLWF